VQQKSEHSLEKIKTKRRTAQDKAGQPSTMRFEDSLKVESIRVNQKEKSSPAKKLIHHLYGTKEKGTRSV